MNAHFVVTFQWEAGFRRHDLEVKHDLDRENGLWLLYDHTTSGYRGPGFHSYEDLQEWLYTYTTVHECY